MGPEEPTSDWGRTRRLLFRFVFAYLILYIAPLEPLWWVVVPQVGRHVLRIPVSHRFTASGDTTYHHVEVLWFLVLAMVATAVWTILDRNRANYVRLHEWLRVVVRFYLALAMFAYGGGKFIPDQFPQPSLDRLVEPLGNAQPVQLLWTFMGASVAYNVFTGAAELLGGLLLTARRTTLLGALVCAGVLSNVVMLNLSYDVPVKLFSSHLLLMALFLTVPDLGRLADFFLFNRAVAPAPLPPLFAGRRLRRATLVLRTAFVVLTLGLSLFVSYYHQTYYGDWAPRPPLYGIWEVSEFASDGEVRPPLSSDTQRWRRVIVPQSGPLVIQFMDDSCRRFSQEVDVGTNSLVLSREQQPQWKAVFRYQEPEPGLLALEGTFDGHPVRARLHRWEESRFPLVGHGFHWIIE